MAYGTWMNDNKLGGVTLKATGSAETASTTQTAVELGKGKYRIVTNVSAIDVAGSDEHYLVVLEANTRLVTGTYYEIATLYCGGDSSKTGRSADDVADEIEIIVDNPYDYVIRVRSYMIGATTSLTYSVTAYALDSKE